MREIFRWLLFFIFKQMKNNTNPLFPEKLYHIYNRGINGTNLFIEDRNYAYFLSKYLKFVLPIAELYAYCLMKNHFHLLIQVKSEDAIRRHFEKDGKSTERVETNKLISKAFNSFFKSYAVTINQTYGRTGRLFEEPFLRIEVNSNHQISTLIKYIHHNPVKHGFTTNFREYPHTSYHKLTEEGSTWLSRIKVLNWFGGNHEFISFHEINSEELRYDPELNLYI